MNNNNLSMSLILVPSVILAQEILFCFSGVVLWYIPVFPENGNKLTLSTTHFDFGRLCDALLTQESTTHSSCLVYTLNTIVFNYIIIGFYYCWVIIRLAFMVSYLWTPTTSVCGFYFSHRGFESQLLSYFQFRLLFVLVRKLVIRACFSFYGY